MLNVETAIIEELATISQVSDRLYPLVAPPLDEDGKPTVNPYVVYEANMGEYVKTLDGYIEPDYISFRFEVAATHYTVAKNIADSVINKIKSFAQRTIGNDGLFVSDIEHGEAVESYDDKTKLRIVLIETLIYF